MGFAVQQPSEAPTARRCGEREPDGFEPDGAPLLPISQPCSAEYAALERKLRNGFLVEPEPEAVACDEQSIAPFTLPAEALVYEPSRDEVVTTFKNGDHERKIHCNIELDADEQAQLTALRGEAAQQGLRFYPSISAMATRFLSHARNDRKKALRQMQATQDWRKGYFQGGPISDADVQEDMSHGIVYFCGRDTSLRPALVVRGSRIPQQWYKEKRVDKLIRLLIFCMEYMLRYMVVPGRVENLSVIVDLAGLGLSQVPLGALGEVYKVMSHHYIGRVFRFYVCNLPPSLSMISGMAKSLLSDRQRQKLVILNDVGGLLRDFSPDQLEADLAGTRPKVETFFPFPLQAGPFNDANAAGSDALGSQPADAHRVLSRDGAVGRLWDPSRSREANLRLECALGAEDVLDRCGLPRPCSRPAAFGEEARHEAAEPWGRPAEEEGADAKQQPDSSPPPCSSAASSTRPSVCSAGPADKLSEVLELHRQGTNSTEEGTARASDEGSSRAEEWCQDDEGDFIVTVDDTVQLDSCWVGHQCCLFGGSRSFGW